MTCRDIYGNGRKRGTELHQAYDANDNGIREMRG